MNEKVVKLGPGGGLVGIVTQPAQAAGRSDLPGVILLNSGILHRIGACRLHVKIARRLAAHGYTSLRFDHAGIGDSEQRRGIESFEESALKEIVGAMDYLTRSSGVRRFLLMGLCSGADMAYTTAIADERVAGIVQLDPYVYRTAKSRLNFLRMHYLPRLLRLSAWQRLVVRSIKKPLQRLTAKNAAAEGIDWYVAPEYVRRFPAQSEIARGLTALMNRGMRLCCIFSGGQPDLYNYQDQFQDCFKGVPFAGHLTVKHFPDANHIFTNLDHQSQILDLIEAWTLSADKVAHNDDADQGSPARLVAGG